MDHTQLFRDYRDDVYRLAVCYTRSREDAEDVCQTVFLKLMEQRNFQPGREKQCLLRVTANECKNLLLRRNLPGWYRAGCRRRLRP